MLYGREAAPAQTSFQSVGRGFNPAALEGLPHKRCHCEERSDAAIRTPKRKISNRFRFPSPQSPAATAPPPRFAGEGALRERRPRGRPTQTLSLRGAKRRGNPFPAQREKAPIASIGRLTAFYELFPAGYGMTGLDISLLNSAPSSSLT